MTNGLRTTYVFGLLSGLLLVIGELAGTGPRVRGNA